MKRKKGKSLDRLLEEGCTDEEFEAALEEYERDMDRRNVKPRMVTDEKGAAFHRMICEQIERNKNESI